MFCSGQEKIRKKQNTSSLFYGPNQKTNKSKGNFHMYFSIKMRSIIYFHRWGTKDSGTLWSTLIMIAEISTAYITQSWTLHSPFPIEIPNND